MGNGILELITQKLQAVGLRTEPAYPGRRMPRIGQIVAAVHIRKLDPVRSELTVEVTIAAPERFGGAACEEEAILAMEVLGETGAVCVMSGCDYDNRGQVYTVTIQAEYSGVVGTEASPLGSGIRVYIENEAVIQALAFTAEKESASGVLYEMGGGEAVVSMGPWVWKIQLEELMPRGLTGISQPQEGFTLRLSGLQSEEIFTDCCWVSTRYEYTPKGVRRIRSGYALAREEISWEN